MADLLRWDFNGGFVEENCGWRKWDDKERMPWVKWVRFINFLLDNYKIKFMHSVEKFMMIIQEPLISRRIYNSIILKTKR